MGDPLRWRKIAGLAGLVTMRIALLVLVLQLCVGRVDGLGEILREGRGERLLRFQAYIDSVHLSLFVCLTSVIWVQKTGAQLHICGACCEAVDGRKEREEVAIFPSSAGPFLFVQKRNPRLPKAVLFWPHTSLLGGQYFWTKSERILSLWSKAKRDSRTVFVLLGSKDYIYNSSSSIICHSI